MWVVCSTQLHSDNNILDSENGAKTQFGNYGTQNQFVAGLVKVLTVNNWGCYRAQLKEVIYN